MKSKQTPQVPITTINNQFNAPVGTAYINSTHHSNDSFEITLQTSIAFQRAIPNWRQRGRYMPHPQIR
jgi:hypothetical protein